MIINYKRWGFEPSDMMIFFFYRNLIRMHKMQLKKNKKFKTFQMNIQKAISGIIGADVLQIIIVINNNE